MMARLSPLSIPHPTLAPSSRHEKLAASHPAYTVDSSMLPFEALYSSLLLPQILPPPPCLRPTAAALTLETEHSGLTLFGFSSLTVYRFFFFATPQKQCSFLCIFSSVVVFFIHIFLSFLL